MEKKCNAFKKYDWLRAGRSGDRIPVGGRDFPAPVQTGPGTHPASCTMGTGSFLVVKSGRGVTLTPHPLLVPWSWKSRAIPLLPLQSARPVQSLSAYTRVHFYSACAANVGRNPAKFMLHYRIYLYSSHSNRLTATRSTVYCISIFIFYWRLLCFLTFDIKILWLKALPFLSRTELPSRSSRLMNIFVHEA